MKYIAVNNFLDFAKQKYNIFFILLLVYIIRVEIEYGYFHMIFGIFFLNNPISSYLLTILQPSHLKLIEIWLKFHIVFIVSYIFYYSIIEKPKDLREFLIIKRNFSYYPLVFIYVLVFIFFYDILLTIETGRADVQSEISFLQAFIVVEILTYVLFVYKFMDIIDAKWNLVTSKELNIWNEKKFLKNNEFVRGVSAGFTNKEDWEKSRELKIKYPFEMKYYEKMKQGNFPDLDEYFKASYWNIDNFDEWTKSSNYKPKKQTKKQYKKSRNLFDFNEYFKYTVTSKFNIIFLIILIASIIDYTIFINGFYTGQNYVSKLTYDYFVNRWIIFFGILIIAYFIYFFLYKVPEKIVEATFIKVNSIVYPIILFLVTFLRMELFDTGTPQAYKNLPTRILENVMQPFFGSGTVILLLLLPLIIFIFFQFHIIPENLYYEYKEGNFVSYGNYKKSKTADVTANPEYTDLLSKQPYLKNSISNRNPN